MLIRGAITGGPCGGKDDLLKPESLEEIGKKKHIRKCIIAGTEAATEIIKMGIRPEKFLKLPDRQPYLLFQEMVAKRQLNIEEDQVADAIKILDPRVALFNRGFPDLAAYTQPEEYASIIQKICGAPLIEARDSRYQFAMHMSTLADGKPDLYMKLYRNNPSRYENTPRKALAADLRTRNAWLGHPHLRIIPNYALDGRLYSWEEKVELFADHLAHVLSDDPMEYEEKFHAVDGFDLRKIPVPYVTVPIKQTYLMELKPGWQSRVRKRTQYGSSLYYETHKGAMNRERETIITRARYQELRERKDPSRLSIYKDRVYFLWKNQYFELDFITKPAHLAGVVILELELLNPKENFMLPPWLGKLERVTDDKKYSSRNLAKKP